MPERRSTRHALLTACQMQQADAAVIAGGIAGYALMQRAGAVVVEEIRRRYGKRPVLVLCGPGNNGGDGFVIARLLQEAGWEVTVAALKPIDTFRGDAAKAAADWGREVVSLPESMQTMKNGQSEAMLVIDALFGTGLQRALTGEVQELVEAVNASGLPVVAVDMPSGIDSDSGAVLGAAVRVDMTVTFCRKKRGHLLLPGREYGGEVVLRDIGIPDSAVQAESPDCFENHPGLWRDQLPVPEPEGHKHRRGHVLVRGGIPGMTGAAALAGLAALRGGAGLVSVQCSEATLPAYQGDIGLMTALQPYGEALENSRYSSLLLGPGNGIGEETRDAVLAALATGKPCVLDADALTAFSGETALLAGAITTHGILTPHAGEFARLFEVGDNKVVATVNAARQVGAIVVHKGADTVIAGPDGQSVINSNAPPWLATAGSGDVLAGFCAALLAQGMPPFEAACAAVWLHGQAATEMGNHMIAQDLAEKISYIRLKLEMGLYGQNTQ